MDERFEIRPRVGLGTLTFGLSPDAVAAAAAAYGRYVAGPGDAASEAALASTLELLGDALSEADKAALAASMRTGGTTATIAELPLALDFADGKLATITTGVGIALSVDGAELYAMEPLDALRALERANGAPGRYNSTGAYFDAIAVGTEGFHILDGETIRPMPRNDERFSQRSVGLSAAPYAPEAERPFWTTLSLPA